MCGILGAYSPNGIGETLPFLDEDLDKLYHRGPNQKGWFVDRNLVLGFRRLSIIDVSSGSQPFFNETLDVVSAVNGEIYNHHKLRSELKPAHTFRTEVDCETVVHAYEEYGDDFVNKLDGMFAFALYDRRDGRLLLGRDRAGKKPLYYRWQNDTLLFSSEIKPLIKRMKPRISREALNDYLRFGYVPAPLTMLEGIYKIPAGSLLKVEGEKVARVRKFWEYQIHPAPREPDSKETEEYWYSSLRNELKRAVCSRLESEVPMGFLLSGGIDSSAVLALGAQALEGKQVKAFTIGVKGEDTDESGLASEVARRYEVNHQIIALDAVSSEPLTTIMHSVEEPVSTDALIPTDRVFRAVAKAGITTVLSGEGADEVFAGYRKFKRAEEHGVHQSDSPLEHYLRHEEFTFPDEDEREELLNEVVWDGRFKELEEESSELDPLSQMLFFEARLRLPDRINLRLDRLSMAHSIEARAPFMDHRLMEFCSTIPHRIRTGAGFNKNVLRMAMRDALPQSIIQNAKQPFHAPSSWQTELAVQQEGLLSRDALEESGVFNPQVVERLKMRMARGDQAAQEKIFSLTVFQAWYEGFFKKLSA